MGVCNVVSLVLLVFIFTADCKANEISCDDVTARVGKEFNLTCRVSYKDNKCCMIKYKIINKNKNTEIYKEQFRNDHCLQNTSITLPHTAHEVMTTTFKFVLQTTCDAKTAEFSVNITDAVKEETAGGSEHKDETPVQTDKTNHQDKSALAVIISVLSCFTIIIIVAFIIKRKRNTSASQREYDKGVCVCENNISKHTDIETAVSQV